VNVDEALATTSIIIPVKDDLRLRTCLDSVDEDVEIVLALNAATDAIRELAAQHPRRPTTVEIDDANIGAAYNAGASVAKGRFLLFMDSDCVFHPGTIRKMAAKAIDHPVVKGLCSFTAAQGRVSDVIRRAREFQTSDHCNAYRTGSSTSDCSSRGSRYTWISTASSTTRPRPGRPTCAAGTSTVSAKPSAGSWESS
jgi:glycosyltransferase involved in cell wall biosynthesis